MTPQGEQQRVSATAGHGTRGVLVTLCLTRSPAGACCTTRSRSCRAGSRPDTGWSAPAVTGAFSAGLVTSALMGIAVGRRLDRYGPRWIMTGGSVLAALSLVAVVGAPNFPCFVAAWVLAGAAMSAVFYAPAFAALTGAAAVALGLGGAGQVLGRLGYQALVRRVDVVPRTVMVMAGVAVTTALLGLFDSLAALAVIAFAAGTVRGVMTLLQATAVTERWGTAHYGHLSGILSAPVMITTALGPFIGAALASLLDGYAAMFLVLGAIAGAAAALAAATAPREAVAAERYRRGG